MAVYWVSLRQVAALRARLAERLSPPPQVEASPPACAVPPSGETSAARQWPPSDSAENPLNLSAAEMQALLAQCGEPGGKALLALIYRLAALETRVSELGARRAGARAASAKRGLVHPIEAPGAPESKSALLEQVFRKNLALRAEGNED